MKRAKKFLKENNNVKLTVRFKGRQMKRKQFGHELLEKAVKELNKLAKTTTKPKWQGRSLTVNLKPI